MGHTFEQRAVLLVENGYRIVPITPGGKRPAIDNWQKLHATADMARQWAKKGFANANIGILTEDTPAIDIDIYDAEVADRMEAWILDHIAGAADAPRRVGRAPKRLLLFRTDTPFRKMQAEYRDANGQKHKLEVLGTGQQFVAYGTHPDTGKPFEWTSFDQPLDVEAASLPVLSADDARRAVAAFEDICRELGWQRVSGSTPHSIARVTGVGNSDDDALLSLKKPLDVSIDEIKAALEYISPDSGYSRWCEVGMALHHQFSGGEEGLELWDAWSQGSTQYDRNEIEEKWPTFSDVPDGRSPITVATILKLANEAKAREQEEEFERVLNVVRTATDHGELFKTVAKQVVAAITNEFQFDIAAKKMQERAKELTGVAPRLDTVRKALHSLRQKKSESAASMPEWCRNWVYIENGDRFFNVETKQELTERGFNAKFDRELIPPEDRAVGIAAPQAHASAMALNVYNIPTVYSTVYLPGFPRIVEVLGRPRANTYDETSIPETKVPETPEEHEAIRLVEQHFRMTFPDERERSLVLDYLCYNVQFPAEKIAWGVLIQGAEGVGKTYLLKLMQLVLGPQNVSPLSASALQENFNGWAEGSKMLFIEELRMAGSNRYEIVEKLKECIANEDVTIRRMNRDRYAIPNVTNYVAFTNYWDALPIKKSNRRYLVVSTHLQSDADVAAFNRKYPAYFADLFNATFAHPGVLRGWMLTRPLSPWFEPKKPAPETSARRKMADAAEVSDEGDAISDLLEKAKGPTMSDRLLTLSALRDAASNAGVVIPSGRALVTLLAKMGFHSLGRIAVEGEKTRCFTREPAYYPADESLCEMYVQAAARGEPLPSPRDPLDFGTEDGEEDIWS